MNTNIRLMRCVALWYRTPDVRRRLASVCILVTGLFSLCVFNVNAQSLPTFLELAMDNNLGLKVSQGEYESYIERAVQVRQLPNPELGVGYFPIPAETRSGPQIVRFSASQRFPWFGSLQSASDVESTRALALNERTSTEELQLEYEVKVAYYTLYELEISKEIISRNIEVLTALENLALSKLESGIASASDVLRVRIDIEELWQDLALIETSWIRPEVNMNQMLNRPLDTKILIDDNLEFAVLPFNKDSIYANIDGRHPLLRMYELEQDVSRNIDALSELEFKPTFGVGIDYTVVNKYAEGPADINGRDFLQISASVSIPLDGEKYSAIRREQKLQIDVLRDKRADAFLMFTSGIEKAYAKYDDARLKYDLYITQIRLTQSAIEIIEADYSAQGLKFDELLILETELIDYDLKLLSAIVQSHIARSEIELYIVN
jgi:outer membrane protein TolC